ncbi:hypothetical protein BC835DRAFT_1402331 [Cytidiella melzeri]|nr:hypothetical protein BC835DRAFT_1402331 [Cytidiella melzeri]
MRPTCPAGLQTAFLPIPAISLYTTAALICAGTDDRVATSRLHCIGTCNSPPLLACSGAYDAFRLYLFQPR